MSTNGHSANGHCIIIHSDGATTTDYHLTEATSVHRTRTYHRDSDITYILGLLRNQAATGTILIDLSQGGVGSIRFEEKQKI